MSTSIFSFRIISKSHLRITLILILVSIITFIMVGPFIWTLMMSFRFTNEIMIKPYGLPIPFRIDNFLRAFTEFGFGQYALNTCFVVIMSVLIINIVSTMAAYCFARRKYQFRMREGLFYLLFLSMMFPPQIFLLSLFQLLMKYRLYNNLWGLILVYSAMGLPLTMFILRAFFAQIPQSLEDAACIDGCNGWNTFWRIMFPMAMPAISTTVIINFIRCWNEFLFAVTFITKQSLRTLPLAVMFFMGESHIDIGLLAAGVIVSSIPILLLYSVMSEKFIKGMTAGAVKY